MEIGDYVLCVDDKKQPHTVEELNKDVPNWVKEGQEYVIRGFAEYFGEVLGVWLEEVHNAPKLFKIGGKQIFAEPSFAIWRFNKTGRRVEKQVESKEEVNYALN